MAELLTEAGLPDGVFNVVHGDKEAVDAILAHPGSAPSRSSARRRSRRYIYETGAAHGKRVQALGGAKNHAVVLPDADIAFAADAIIGAGYGSAGERCMAISAVVAVGDAGDTLVARARRARATRQGRAGRRGRTSKWDRSSPAPRATGSSATSTAASPRARRLVVDGRKPRVRGSRQRLLRRADAVRQRDAVDGDLPRRDLRTGARRRPRGLARRRRSRSSTANPYANGAALFTRSGHAARRFQQDVEVGMVGINVPIPVPMAFYSFGGWRNSLFGDLHVHGMDGVRFYTRGKAVTARWPDDGSAAPGFHMPLDGLAREPRLGRPARRYELLSQRGGREQAGRAPAVQRCAAVAPAAAVPCRRHRSGTRTRASRRSGSSWPMLRAGMNCVAASAASTAAANSGSPSTTARISTSPFASMTAHARTVPSLRRGERRAAGR